MDNSIQSSTDVTVTEAVQILRVVDDINDIFSTIATIDVRGDVLQ